MQKKSINLIKRHVFDRVDEKAMPIEVSLTVFMLNCKPCFVERLGELICTHLRCPEAGHRYTNYKSMGLENIEPESNLNQPAGFESSTRKPDSCLECDHLTGSSVCGLKQWKTFPTFCHAMFCGKNSDKQIDDSGGCESLVCITDSPCNSLLLSQGDSYIFFVV